MMSDQKSASEDLGFEGSVQRVRELFGNACARFQLVDFQAIQDPEEPLYQLTMATYEFNRGAGLSAVRHEPGSEARSYIEDIRINLEQVKLGKFQPPSPHEFGWEQEMVSAADAICMAMSSLPLTKPS